MPTPLGHALAGIAIAWVVDRRARVWLPFTAAAVATLPDLDILVNAHRNISHSLGAAAMAGSLAALVAVWWKLPAARVTAVCFLGYASHVLLDWLGKDSASPAGLPALWPLTGAYLVSGLDLFDEVSRRYWRFDEFVIGNLWSVARELVILGPVAAFAWWARSRATARQFLQSSDRPKRAETAVSEGGAKVTSSIN
jgi:hypothetical protein